LREQRIGPCAATIRGELPGQSLACDAASAIRSVGP